MASEMGLTQQDVSGSVLVSLSSTSQVSPNFWVNPDNRVNYRVAVQTPAAGAHTFEDVPTTQPFFAYIETAAAKNIVSGYTCGQAPAGPCVAPANKPVSI